MADIFDYLDWRGGLSLSQDGFNAIDSLLLSQLAYIDFADIVGSDFKTGILLHQAAKLYNNKNKKREASLGAFINPKTETLLERASATKRFSGIKLLAYVNSIDSLNEKQFSAVSVQLDKKTYVLVFRGTDDTLIGWKEDLNMSFICPVPSQLDALAYLEAAAAKTRGRIFVSGHSKGGNLAVYAAAFCSKRVQGRIELVYNHDGPGFPAEIANKPEYQNLVSRVQTYIPQSSFFGMLLERKEPYIVVQSNKIGIMQHDIFSWHIMANQFVTQPERSDASYFFDKTMRAWLSSIDPAGRELFIDTVYQVLQVTEAKTLTELTSKWIANSGAIIRYFNKIDKPTKNAVLKTFQLLFSAARANFPSIKGLIPK